MFAQPTAVVYQSFPDAVVTRDDGEEAAIEAILPTKVLTHFNHKKNKRIYLTPYKIQLQLTPPPPFFFKKDFQAFFRIKLGT
jgi:hypothetical protein